MSVEVREEPASSLDDYAAIPIAFELSEVFGVFNLLNSGTVPGRVYESIRPSSTRLPRS